MSQDLDSWDARYGDGVIRQRCRAIGSYLAITSPSAWKAAQPHMNSPPVSLEYVKDLEQKHLDSLESRLPNADWVFAIGGGVALDGGKYVAWKKSIPLIMIPTVVSTGAVFQPFVAPRDGGKLAKVIETGAPDSVLFETDVIRQAPPRINSAGMGEPICFLSGVASWRWWWENQHDGAPWDQAAVDEALNWVAARTKTYSSNLDSDGSPRMEAIRASAETNRERRKLRVTGRRGIDHFIDPPFTAINGRSLLHGEAVALGTILTCFLSGYLAEESIKYLKMCRTLYQPKDIGCTWQEIYKVLQALPSYLTEQRAIQDPGSASPLTYLDMHPIDRETFDRFIEFVESH